MDDVFIRGLELPLKVKGVTVLDNNGDYNVYINVLLSADVQKNATVHEIKHIKKNHFYDFNPVIHNELEATS